MYMVSKRTQELTSFIVMDVLEKAKEMERKGVHVIHLEVGEPDFDTPTCVKEAACRALEDGHTHYTHSLGNLDLREAIGLYYRGTYGVSVEPEQIIVTSVRPRPSCWCSRRCSTPGTRSSFPTRTMPATPTSSGSSRACPSRARLRGGRLPVPARGHSGEDQRPDQGHPHQLAFQPYRHPAFRDACGRSRPSRRGRCAHVVSDEIYHGLVYEGHDHSILEFTDRAFVLNGFSKLFAMTGLRLGYVIAPLSLIRPMQKLQQNFFISANAMVQKAGIAALQFAGDAWPA